MANLRNKKAPPSEGVTASEPNAEPTRQSARQQSHTAEPATTPSKPAPNKTKGRPKAKGKRPARKKLDSVAETDEQNNEQAVEHGSINAGEPGNASTAATHAQSEANDALTTASEQIPTAFHSEGKKWDGVLIDLDTKAESISSLVLPLDRDIDSTATELKKPDSVRSGRLRTREIGFQSAFNNFSQHETWIPRDAVVRKSKGVHSLDEVEPGPWRPDSVLYKANLVELAKFFMTRDGHHTDTLPFLQGLDEIFPTPFLASFVPSSVAKKNLEPGESTLTQATFDIALDIRTLMTTSIIRQNPNDDNPEEILNGTFVEDGQPKGWSILFGEDGPGGLSGKLGLAHQDKQDKIRGILHDPNSGLDELENVVDYQSLRYKIMAWIRSRKAELDEQIQHRGGANAISDDWDDEIKAARILNSDLPYPDFVSGGKEARKSLKRMQATNETEQRSSKRTSRPTVGDKSKKASVSKNSPRPQGRVTHADQRVQAAQARALTEPQGNLERPKRFTDAQANARRVSPIGFSQDDIHGQDSSLEQRMLRAPVNASNEDNVSQDHGFQNHERTEADVQANRQQANAMSRKRSQPTKRKAPADSERAGERVGEEPGSESYRENATQDTTMQPASEGTQIPSRPAVLPDSGYGDVNRNAKSVRVQVKDINNFQPQYRTPWTQNETDALVSAIGRLGPRYSKIQKDDSEADGFHLLIHRNQVSLKDKARNMKFDYLK